MSSDSSDDNDDVFRQRTLSFNTAEELSRRDDFAINGFDYHSMGEFLEHYAFKEYFLKYFYPDVTRQYFMICRSSLIVGAASESV